MAQIKPGEKVPFTLAPLKADGSAGELDGAPTITLTVPEVATLTINDDGLSGFVAHNGTVGKTRLQWSADGQLGEGVFAIVGVDDEDLDFIAGPDATSIEATIGAPIPA